MYAPITVRCSYLTALLTVGLPVLTWVYSALSETVSQLNLNSLTKQRQQMPSSVFLAYNFAHALSTNSEIAPKKEWINSHPGRWPLSPPCVRSCESQAHQRWNTPTALSRSQSTPRCPERLVLAPGGRTVPEAQQEHLRKYSSVSWVSRHTGWNGDSCCVHTALLKMGSYSSTTTCQHWDNHLIYQAVYWLFYWRVPIVTHCCAIHVVTAIFNSGVIW